MQHLLFPVGNHLFPVVIILQHAADPVSNTSHSTCNRQAIPGSLQCPLYPQPPLPGAGVKGTDKWLEVEGEMRNEKCGVGKMEDGRSLDQHPPCTHIFASLFSKGRVPGRICGRQMISICHAMMLSVQTT